MRRFLTKWFKDIEAVTQITVNANSDMANGLQLKVNTQGAFSNEPVSTLQSESRAQRREEPLRALHEALFRFLFSPLKRNKTMHRSNYLNHR